MWHNKGNIMVVNNYHVCHGSTLMNTMVGISKTSYKYGTSVLW